MSVVCIVQARLDSRRLPGKVLAPILGHPMLWHVLNRARAMKGVDTVALTVPVGQGVVFEPLAHALSVVVLEGPHPDLLTCYEQVARTLAADVVVRLTADCPLLDPVLCDEVIATYHQRAPRVAYAANVGPESPYPDGLDCEVFSREAVRTASQQAAQQYDRHHVTPFIRQSRLCRYLKVQDVPLAARMRRHKWSVDTGVELAHVRAIMARLPVGATDWRSTLEAASAVRKAQVAHA